MLSRRGFLQNLLWAPLLWNCSALPHPRSRFWLDRAMGWSAQRTIDFAGRLWRVRHSLQEPIGAGPNLWSSAPENVFVDEHGALHMRLVPDQDGRWLCVEVATPLPDRYHRMTIDCEGDLNGLDPHVIAAAFFYRNDTSELDIEFARWGQPNDATNAQYVVAPPSSTRLERFALPGGRTQTQHTITWDADGIDFESRDQDQNLIHAWRYDSPQRPKPDQHWLHINLWLHRGLAPTNRQVADWVIKDVRLF